jgi:phage terminase large subunit
MQINININKAIFNDVYFSLLRNEDRYLVFYGGAGSGKSVFIAQRYIYKLLTQKQCNLLIVRQTAVTNRTSTFALMKQIISKWKVDKLFTARESDMRIKCKNGNEIVFQGLDDIEKLKSITFSSGELSDVWIEEATEVEEASLNQLDVRMRGGNTNKQMVVSFNPVNVNHWLKKRFFDNKPANATILHTTYKDNKFLDDAYIQLLESYKEIDPYYYQVYCLGQWGVYGQSIFPTNVVNERITQLADKKPLKQGYFTYKYDDHQIIDDSIQWVECDTGAIKIYADVDQYHHYVVGGDTAGEGSDNFAGQVIDNCTGTHAATFVNQFDEDFYSRQMYCLGKYYNYALIGLEINFSTYPTKELQRLGYYRQFVRESIDSIAPTTEQKFGFRTDKYSRPIIISNLVKRVKESIADYNDVATLDEMLTFTRNEKGKACAENGAHDDLLMALAIAEYIRPQQHSKPKEPAREFNIIAEHKERLFKKVKQKRRIM